MFGEKSYWRNYCSFRKVRYTTLKVIVRDCNHRLGYLGANCLLHEALLAVTVRVLHGVELVQERRLLVLSGASVAGSVLALADVLAEALTGGTSVGAGDTGTSVGTGQARASGGAVASTSARTKSVLTLANILAEALASGASLTVTSLAGEAGASVRASEAGASLAVTSLAVGAVSGRVESALTITDDAGAGVRASKAGAGLAVTSLAVASLTVSTVGTRVESTLALSNEAGASAAGVRGTGKAGASVRWASEASAGVGWTGQARGTTSVAENASVSTAGGVEELTSAGVVVVAEVVAVVGSAVVELVALLGVGATSQTRAGVGRTSEAGASLIVTSLAVTGLASETRASRAVLVVVRAGEAWTSQTGAGVGRASQTGTVVAGKTAVVVGTAVLLDTGTGEVVWDTIVASTAAGDVWGLLALLTVHVLDAAAVESVLGGVVWCGVAVVGVLSGGGIAVKTLGLVGADLDLVTAGSGLVADGVGLTTGIVLAKITGKMGCRCVSWGFDWGISEAWELQRLTYQGRSTWCVVCMWV
jgi:hypothetical protein